MAAKKEKEKLAVSTSVSEEGSEKSNGGSVVGGTEQFKERKSGKRGAALSFDPDDE